MTFTLYHNTADSGSKRSQTFFEPRLGVPRSAKLTSTPSLLFFFEMTVGAPRIVKLKIPCRCLEPQRGGGVWRAQCLACVPEHVSCRGSNVACSFPPPLFCLPLFLSALYAARAYTHPRTRAGTHSRGDTRSQIHQNGCALIGTRTHMRVQVRAHTCARTQRVRNACALTHPRSRIAHTLSLSLSLSHTHTHTHKYTHAHTHTH